MVLFLKRDKRGGKKRRGLQRIFRVGKNFLGNSNQNKSEGSNGRF